MSKFNVIVNNRFWKKIETNSVLQWLEDNQWMLPDLVKDDEWDTSEISSVDIEYDNNEDGNRFIVEVTKQCNSFLEIEFALLLNCKGKGND